MGFRKIVMITLYARQKKRHRCIEQTFGLCGRRWGWDDLREQHWNKYTIKGETDHQPRLDAWDKCSGLVLGWGGRQEGGSGWGTHVNPWLIHVNVCKNHHNIVVYCKVISLQLIEIIGGKKKETPLIKLSLPKAWRRLSSIFCYSELTCEYWDRGRGVRTQLGRSQGACAVDCSLPVTQSVKGVGGEVGSTATATLGIPRVSHPTETWCGRPRHTPRAVCVPGVSWCVSLDLHPQRSLGVKSSCRTEAETAHPLSLTTAAA